MKSYILTDNIPIKKKKNIIYFGKQIFLTKKKITGDYISWWTQYNRAGQAPRGVTLKEVNLKMQGRVPTVQN